MASYRKYRFSKYNDHSIYYLILTYKGITQQTQYIQDKHFTIFQKYQNFLYCCFFRVISLLQTKLVPFLHYICFLFQKFGKMVQKAIFCLENLFTIMQYITYQMDFKKFIQDKLNYLSIYFRRKAILLDETGEPLSDINLSFDFLSDEYMQKVQQMESQQWQQQNSTMKMEEMTEGLIKIQDNDLNPLWKYLDCSYKLCFNIQGQNITDETLLKISELYEQGKCAFTQLRFSGNSKISQIGGVRLAEALRENQNIRFIDFHGLALGHNGANRIIELIVNSGLRNIDLGLIGNKNLSYLADILKNEHHLQSIAFGEDQKDPWNSGSKAFQQVIRKGEYSKQILSINLYPENIVKHWDLINQLNILCKKRRKQRLNERQNDFKAAALNPGHSKYYDPQNHNQNAYKFSVKSYLTNVFRSDLDEALYFLQKQRRNSLRQQQIFQITREPINKLILEDICTADGSILVLAKYLLGKIKEKKQ